MIWTFLILPMMAMAALTRAERRAGRGSTETARNIAAWLLMAGVGFAILPFIHGWRGHALIDGQSVPLWFALPLFIVLRDAGEFTYHVAQHKIPVLWRMHALHHSDPDMCALTANRHFWGDQIVKQVTIWALPAMIIAPTAGIVAAYSVVSLYHLFVHANLRVGLGRWSWLLNTPAYHRRHHSALPEHYDTNFAGLFPIFDVLAGTYRRPDGWPPSGLESQPESLLDVALWPLRLGRAAPPQDLSFSATKKAA